VENSIGTVLAGLPRYIKHIIIVDDASPDGTSKILEKFAGKDHRIVLIQHKKNMGVGGAMRTGFQKALELDAQIVVKVDGDDQMDLAYLPDMITPLVEGRADYTKGNRFQDFQALQQMPLIRRIGNMGLSFLTKAATGYWNLFYPTNGFIAIRASALDQLPLDRISNSFFFETSMLANLYMVGAVVKDVSMPARYGSETSNLSIRRTLIEFPFKLLQTFLRRLFVRYMIYDFSMASIYMLAGLPLLFFGLIFGLIKWAQYAARNITAPTGTVMLSTLSVLLGIQFLIAAIEIDMRSTPREPLSHPL
jgi:glycosyltransferase involved in cell wall biosynthesis